MRDKTQVKDRLRGLIATGAEAEGLLKRLDPRFVALRERYRSSLVHSVRTGADEKEIVMGACRVAALEDLYEELYQDAKTGARATEMATQLESEATK